ncbi:sulfite exporter TauE/SafE family protein [Ruegeria hyattellae]|uniref:sulfite exporter TauE/SafE family protein n=1 Tax=Ruegeria hyattellae TaxID=3233337 RepID=UPI00355B4F4C
MLVLAIAMLAGMVRGMVGFAMPMIFVSGLSTLLPPDWALAGLILPTLVTNGMQALRHGAEAAVRSIRRFRVFLLFKLVWLLATSQLETRIPASIFLLLIAVPVVAFAAIQLLGGRSRLGHASSRSDALVGAFADGVGGMSGVWGPPIVAYLNALNTPKRDQMRIQGVIYGLGAVALAHLGSGVLRSETLPLSLVLILPAAIGMWLGGRWQDRIDQNVFRKLTLIVLLLAGLNLLLRALMG